MSTIVTRAGKGSPLTHTEVDNNFTNLNTDKAEDSSVVKLTGDQTINGTKTFSNTITGSISGNAGTATNGVVTTGSYANPSWITSLDDGKVLPSMSGNSGKYLTTDGTDSSWASLSPTLISDQNNTSTGYFDLPSGTTAQRPVSPTVGMIRYNTTESEYEVYYGTEWKAITTKGFPYSVDYLVIAGGGAGGPAGAGGGAGGYRTGSLSLTPSTVYTVTVGAGGGDDANGNNSVFSTITSIGGGRGGINNTTLNIGGSGGSGGGSTYAAGGTGNTYAGGAGTSGQGNNGGGFTPSSGNAAGGGGGGAGAAGTANSVSVGGNGGNGSASSITGTSVTRAGGGAGWGEGGNGTAGTGGGGAVNANGSANTGGGGGSSNAGTFTSGGSGVVIISVPTANYTGVTTGSPTVTTSGSNTIIQFNSSGSYTA